MEEVTNFLLYCRKTLFRFKKISYNFIFKPHVSYFEVRTFQMTRNFPEKIMSNFGKVRKNPSKHNSLNLHIRQSQFLSKSYNIHT